LPDLEHLSDPSLIHFLRASFSCESFVKLERVEISSHMDLGYLRINLSVHMNSPRSSSQAGKPLETWSDCFSPHL
jgi:hypothetical protein